MTLGKIPALCHNRNPTHPSHQSSHPFPPGWSVLRILSLRIKVEINAGGSQSWQSALWSEHGHNRLAGLVGGFLVL